MTGAYKLHGGLAFEPALFGAIETLPLPEHIGIQIDRHATPAITVGDHVLKGQVLCEGEPDQALHHASVSGEVTGISQGVISIKSDGQDNDFISPRVNAPSALQINALCKQYGLVGLGGAAFPVNKKLDSIQHHTPDTLLINAAECDPAIYCDEALMQERTEDIVKGIELALAASSARQCIVGIEENKTEAIAKLLKHLPAEIKLVSVPALYPSGAENTLFSLCTGQTGGLRKHHSLCFNIATCYAIYKAVILAEPLISRVVTVITESTVRNFELRIGTPITDLCNHLSQPLHSAITCGGQMMGWPVTSEQYIDKRTNSLIFHPPRADKAVACIRCGACADVCPEKLLPQQLLWHAKPHNRQALLSLDLHNCIECACCDVVCPSHIPLTEYFIHAKKKIRSDNTEQKKAELAKIRYEARLARLQNQSKRERKKLDAKSADLSNSKNKDQLKKDLIAKALQKSKSKKQQPPEKNTDGDRS